MCHLRSSRQNHLATIGTLKDDRLSPISMKKRWPNFIICFLSGLRAMTNPWLIQTVSSQLVVNVIVSDLWICDAVAGEAIEYVRAPDETVARNVSSSIAQ